MKKKLKIVSTHVCVHALAFIVFTKIQVTLVLF